MIGRRRLPLSAALLDRLGPARLVRVIGSSPRSRVWQIDLGGTPAIVKQIIAGSRSGSGSRSGFDADSRFAREVTALRRAGGDAGLASAGEATAVRRAGAVVPALLGTDPAVRVLVLEYLTPVPGTAMLDNFASDAEVAAAAHPPYADWAVRYATALAQLHAAGPGDLPVAVGPTPGDVSAFLRLARALGVPEDPGVEGELHALLDRLAAAGATALLHGDPCPGNEITTADGIRFVDLESAEAGSGLTELAYLRIGFPTCWSVRFTPDPVRRAAELAYRQTWQALTGTEPPGDLTDACLGWLLRSDALVQRSQRDGTDYFERMLVQDWQWGTMTARERVGFRVGEVAAAVSGRRDLAATSALLTALLPALTAMRGRLP